MRIFLISAALLSAAAVAAPASAQYYSGPYGYNHGYGYSQGYGYSHGYSYNHGYRRQIAQQLTQVQHRIDRSFRNGRISHQQANALFRRANRIERLYGRYAYNGLSGYEVRDLQHRIHNLRETLRWTRQQDRYYEGY